MGKSVKVQVNRKRAAVPGLKKAPPLADGKRHTMVTFRVTEEERQLVRLHAAACKKTSTHLFRDLMSASLDATAQSRGMSRDRYVAFLLAGDVK